MVEGAREGFAVVAEGQDEVLRIDASAWSYSPSVEENPLVMGLVVDKLVENPGVKRVVLYQRRNFTYEYDQTQLLVEVAQVYNHLVRGRKVLSVQGLGFQEGLSAFFGEKLGTLQYVVYTLLRSDPVGCYVELRRLIREEKVLLGKEVSTDLILARQRYVEMLSYMLGLLERSKLIALVKDQVEGLQVGDRGVYKGVFRAVVTPDFMVTRLMAQVPLDGQEVDVYGVGDTDVTVVKVPNEVKLLYHVNPVEFKLNDEEYGLIELARGVLGEHKPREEEFLDPARLRRTIFNIGRDLVEELAQNKGVELDFARVEVLARVLVRYTVGFGLLEVLLSDEKVQDVVVNSPVGASPVFVVHQEFGECVTNVVPSREDAEGWATKLRLLSGRPLDEANPVLDSELLVPGARSRISVMTRPLSPSGLAFALRRHRDQPWTLPLFMQNRMLSPLAAGLISFLVDGARSVLVAGTRGSGKTSVLGAIMTEIMRKYRVLVVEDTQEIPVEYLRSVGYNIQNMKVRSALTTGGVELGADEGIRTSLRFGDSALIVGEVRSVEAKALFEAMRVGALANVVAGTIHGADPYGVFDRVVNDLGVPRTSFKAADIIMVANPVVSADGLRRWRRLLQVTEVRKHWQEDPLREGGFVDLLRYDVRSDRLEVSEDLRNGESEVVKAVAGNVREWVGNWDAVWENILLRSRVKEALVDAASRARMGELLEADFVVRCNDVFHRVCEEVREEVGVVEGKRVFGDWREWLRREVKGRRV